MAKTGRLKGEDNWQQLLAHSKFFIHVLFIYHTNYLFHFIFFRVLHDDNQRQQPNDNNCSQWPKRMTKDNYLPIVSFFICVLFIYYTNYMIPIIFLGYYWQFCTVTTNDNNQRQWLLVRAQTTIVGFLIFCLFISIY